MFRSLFQDSQKAACDCVSKPSLYSRRQSYLANLLPEDAEKDAEKDAGKELGRKWRENRAAILIEQAGKGKSRSGACIFWPTFARFRRNPAVISGDFGQFSQVRAAPAERN